MRPPPRSTLFPYTTLFRSFVLQAHLHESGVRRRVARVDGGEVGRRTEIGDDQAQVFRFDHPADKRSEEHMSELQSLRHLVCRLLLEKKKMKHMNDGDTKKR